MRPIWKGSIAFGLVSIPVELYSAEKRTELHFHLLDSRTQSRVHYERINDETGEEVPWNDVIKAFEFEKGSYVMLKEEDFKRAAPKAFKTIDIENFVDLNEIEYPYFDRPYYLVPENGAEKAYVLLRDALKATHKVGVAKIVIRSKQYLACVIPGNTSLMLNLLRFDQELRKENEFNFPQETLKTYRITEKEINMAKELIAGMTSSWDPSSYHDEYRESLMKWIEEKATQGKAKTTRKKPEKTEEASKVIDFMELLSKSLASTKSKAKPKRTAKGK